VSICCFCLVSWFSWCYSWFLCNYCYVCVYALFGDFVCLAWVSWWFWCLFRCCLRVLGCCLFCGALVCWILIMVLWLCLCLRCLLGYLCDCFVILFWFIVSVVDCRFGLMNTFNSVALIFVSNLLCGFFVCLFVLFVLFVMFVFLIVLVCGWFIVFVVFVCLI